MKNWIWIVEYKKENSNWKLFGYPATNLKKAKEIREDCWANYCDFDWKKSRISKYQRIEK